MGKIKNINIDGCGVVVGASAKSAGSSPKMLRRPENDVMIVAKMSTNSETAKNQKRSGREEDGVWKGFQQSRIFSRSGDSAKMSGTSQPISSEKSKVVSATAISQGPSSRTWATKK